MPCLPPWPRKRPIEAGRRAIELDPNYADGHVRLGETLCFAGRAEEGIELIRKAMRLDPHPFVYFFVLGTAHYYMGEHEEAIRWLERAITRNPNHFSSHHFLAAIYGQLDRREEARAEAAEVLRLSPDFSVERRRAIQPWKDEALLERHNDDLRKAGLPN